MLRKLRPSSAYDVMAAIAFFIAVAGGGAYAAATIGSGSIQTNAVLSRHIKNGQVKNPDLGANSVGTGKVLNGSLTGADLNKAKLGAIPLATNAGALQGKQLSDWGGHFVINGRFGPLPLENTFHANGGLLLVIASGSGFRSSANTKMQGHIGMDIILDGSGVTDLGPTVFTNERDSHRAFVSEPLLLPNVLAGEHTLRLENLYEGTGCNVTGVETTAYFCTTTDGNDVFNVSIIEFPRP